MQSALRRAQSALRAALSTRKNKNFPAQFAS
jgi:hypothetical protein